jgi:hypothetical protein
MAEIGLKTGLREDWHIEIVRLLGLIICKTGVRILWDPRSSAAADETWGNRAPGTRTFRSYDRTAAMIGSGN